MTRCTCRLKLYSSNTVLTACNDARNKQKTGVPYLASSSHAQILEQKPLVCGERASATIKAGDAAAKLGQIIFTTKPKRPQSVGRQTYNPLSVTHRPHRAVRPPYNFCRGTGYTTVIRVREPGRLQITAT